MDNSQPIQFLQALEPFDLRETDLNLRILYCDKAFPPVNNIVTIDAQTLPALPFEDQVFDLALCSHFLFTDNEQLSESFHIRALLELARVATEVRVYPLMDREGHPSVHLGPILQALQHKGFGVELKHVATTTHPEGGNAVLRLWNEACVLKDSSKEASNNTA